MKPTVSVIIPVYNAERYLKRCLDSIAGQSLREIEIICVDDGSPDGSLEILHAYATGEPRMRVISQKNKRQGGARNTGFDAARGEWVAFVDSDDRVAPDYLEKLLEAATRHAADIACTNVEKQRGNRRKWNVHYTKEEVFCGLQEKFDACHCPPNFNTTNKLYRREALLRSGIRFREHAVYEDVEYQAQTLCSLGRLVTVPDTVYYYMVHGASTTKSRQTPQKQRDKYNAHKAFVAFADANGIRIGRRFRDVTLREYTLWGVSLMKIKDNGCRRVYRLFDLLPVFSQNLK